MLETPDQVWSICFMGIIGDIFVGFLNFMLRVHETLRAMKGLIKLLAFIALLFILRAMFLNSPPVPQPKASVAPVQAPVTMPAPNVTYPTATYVQPAVVSTADQGRTVNINNPDPSLQYGRFNKANLAK
jgi:predicted lipid-binding transport protein (Tim44 family)